MNTIKDIINHLSKGRTVVAINEFYLGMGEDGVIRDQDNNIWDITGTKPSDYKFSKSDEPDAVEVLAKVSMTLCDLLRSKLT